MRHFANILLILICTHLMPSLASESASGSSVTTAASAAPKTILVLYPFNGNVPTLQQLAAGISSVIVKNNLRSADVVYEYLDIAPPANPAQPAIVRDLLLNKYANRKFDLIVTYGQIATDFLLNELQDISPDSPCVVLFGSARQRNAQAARRVIHIPLQLNLKDTLQLGLTMFPNTRKILFVAGSSTNDLQIEARARAEFADWRGKLEFEYTSSQSVERLMAGIGQLPPQTLVIFSNVAADVTGKSFVPRDVVTELASKSNAPVLSIFSTQIDTGVVGGAMFNMERVGELIGNFLIALKSGIPLDLDTESSSRLITPMFNWAQIERWGINPALLPVNSVFINRPLTLWGQYRTAVILAGGLIAILSAMSIALFIQNRRRAIAEISAREAAAQLLVERDQLEDRVAKRTEHLAEALDFNKTILLNSPVPMGIYEADGQCIMANEAYAEFVGSTPAELLKQNFYGISSWRQTCLLDDCIEALAQGTAQQREANVVTSFGKEVWFEYRILPKQLKGKSHLLIQFFDLSERKRVEEELRHWAFHDPLTRLTNRRLLMDRLEQALRTGKRENGYLAVLFVDLDKFKQVNDNYGHDAGDQLLIEVASRLQQCVRSSDTVARIGGDEFVVLLAGLGTDFEQAQKFANTVVNKIRTTLDGEYVLGDIQYHGTASIGTKVVLGGDHDPDQILKDADAAMYVIKHQVMRSHRAG